MMFTSEGTPCRIVSVWQHWFLQYLKLHPKWNLEVKDQMVNILEYNPRQTSEMHEPVTLRWATAVLSNIKSAWACCVYIWRVTRPASWNWKPLCRGTHLPFRLTSLTAQGHLSEWEEKEVRAGHATGALHTVVCLWHLRRELLRDIRSGKDKNWACQLCMFAADRGTGSCLSLSSPDCLSSAWLWLYETLGV